MVLHEFPFIDVLFTVVVPSEIDGDVILLEERLQVRDKLRGWAWWIGSIAESNKGVERQNG